MGGHWYTPNFFPFGSLVNCCTAEVVEDDELVEDFQEFFETESTIDLEVPIYDVCIIIISRFKIMTLQGSLMLLSTYISSIVSLYIEKKMTQTQMNAILKLQKKILPPPL